MNRWFALVAILAPFNIASAGSLCVFTSNPLINNFRQAPEIAQDDVKEILSALGQNSKYTVFIGPVGNAAAFPAQPDVQAFIAYDESFFRRLYNLNPWAPVSVLAHEVGHHVGNKQTSVSSHTRELNADEISGCALAHMGATLTQAKVALKDGLPSLETASHPATARRLKAVETGWKTCLIRSKQRSEDK